MFLKANYDNQLVTVFCSWTAYEQPATFSDVSVPIFFVNTVRLQQMLPCNKLWPQNVFCKYFFRHYLYAFCHDIAAWVNKTIVDVTRQTFAQVCIWFPSTNFSSFCKYFNGRKEKTPPSPPSFSGGEVVVVVILATCV